MTRGAARAEGNTPSPRGVNLHEFNDRSAVARRRASATLCRGLALGFGRAGTSHRAGGCALPAWDHPQSGAVRLAGGGGGVALGAKILEPIAAALRATLAGLSIPGVAS